MRPVHLIVCAVVIAVVFADNVAAFRCGWTSGTWRATIENRLWDPTYRSFPGGHSKVDFAGLSISVSTSNNADTYLADDPLDASSKKSLKTSTSASNGFFLVPHHKSYSFDFAPAQYPVCAMSTTFDIRASSVWGFINLSTVMKCEAGLLLGIIPAAGNHACDAPSDFQVTYSAEGGGWRGKLDMAYSRFVEDLIPDMRDNQLFLRVVEKPVDCNLVRRIQELGDAVLYRDTLTNSCVRCPVPAGCSVPRCPEQSATTPSPECAVCERGFMLTSAGVCVERCSGLAPVEHSVCNERGDAYECVEGYTTDPDSATLRCIPGCKGGCGDIGICASTDRCKCWGATGTLCNICPCGMTGPNCDQRVPANREFYEYEGLLNAAETLLAAGRVVTAQAVISAALVCIRDIEVAEPLGRFEETLSAAANSTEVLVTDRAHRVNGTIIMTVDGASACARGCVRRSDVCAGFALQPHPELDGHFHCALLTAPLEREARGEDTALASAFELAVDRAPLRVGDRVEVTHVSADSGERTLLRTRGTSKNAGGGKVTVGNDEWVLGKYPASATDGKTSAACVEEHRGEMVRFGEEFVLLDTAHEPAWLLVNNMIGGSADATSLFPFTMAFPTAPSVRMTALRPPTAGDEDDGNDDNDDNDDDGDESVAAAVANGDRVVLVNEPGGQSLQWLGPPRSAARPLGFYARTHLNPRGETVVIARKVAAQFSATVVDIERFFDRVYALAASDPQLDGLRGEILVMRTALRTYPSTAGVLYVPPFSVSAYQGRTRTALSNMKAFADVAGTVELTGRVELAHVQTLAIKVREVSTDADFLDEQRAEMRGAARRLADTIAGSVAAIKLAQFEAAKAQAEMQFFLAFDIVIEVFVILYKLVDTIIKVVGVFEGVTDLLGEKKESDLEKVKRLVEGMSDEKEAKKAAKKEDDNFHYEGDALQRMFEDNYDAGTWASIKAWGKRAGTKVGRPAGDLINGIGKVADEMSGPLEEFGASGMSLVESMQNAIAIGQMFGEGGKLGQSEEMLARAARLLGAGGDAEAADVDMGSLSPLAFDLELERLEGLKKSKCDKLYLAKGPCGKWVGSTRLAMRHSKAAVTAMGEFIGLQRRVVATATKALEQRRLARDLEEMERDWRGSLTQSLRVRSMLRMQLQRHRATVSLHLANVCAALRYAYPSQDPRDCRELHARPLGLAHSGLALLDVIAAAERFDDHHMAALLAFERGAGKGTTPPISMGGAVALNEQLWGALVGSPRTPSFVTIAFTLSVQDAMLPPLFRSLHSAKIAHVRPYFVGLKPRAQQHQQPNKGSLVSHEQLPPVRLNMVVSGPMEMQTSEGAVVQFAIEPFRSRFYYQLRDEGAAECATSIKSFYDQNVLCIMEESTLAESGLFQLPTAFASYSITLLDTDDVWDPASINDLEMIFGYQTLGSRRFQHEDSNGSGSGSGAPVVGLCHDSVPGCALCRAECELAESRACMDACIERSFAEVVAKGGECGSTTCRKCAVRQCPAPSEEQLAAASSPEARAQAAALRWACIADCRDAVAWCTPTSVSDPAGCTSCFDATCVFEMPESAERQECARECGGVVVATGKEDGSSSSSSPASTASGDHAHDEADVAATGNLDKTGDSDGGSSSGLAIGLGVTAGVVLIAGIVAAAFYRRNKSQKDQTFIAMVDQ